MSNRGHEFTFAYRRLLLLFQLHLEATHRRLKEAEIRTQAISNGTINNDILQVRWPVGVPPSSVPDTRYDLAIWTMMNLTHSFNYDAETNVRKLSQIDEIDIQVS